MTFALSPASFSLRGLALAAALAATAAPARADDCLAARDALALAMEERAVADLAADARALADAGCSPETVTAALRQLSSLAARRASAALDAGDLDRAADLLAEAPVQHWEVQAMRGAIAARSGAHLAAAQAFNGALDTLGAADITPQDPALEPAARRLMALAQEQMMLAGTAQTTIRSDGTHSGVMKAINDGLLLRSARSSGSVSTDDGRYNVVASAASQVDQVYLPVRFDTDSWALSEDGKAEASALAAFLRHLPRGTALTIVGHTDDVGDAGYNYDLSVKRAETVRSYLMERGITATVLIEGRGEEDPPVLIEPGGYSQEDLRTIARRVEVAFDVR